MKVITTQQFPSPVDDDEDGLLEFSRLAADVAHSANGVMPKKVGGITPTRKKKKSKRDPRGVRRQIQFWLDQDNPKHFFLYDWILELKAIHQFAPVVRTALAIYQELLAGETTMLYELFPKFKPAPLPPPMPSPEIEKMQKKIESLEDQVELLKGILIKQSGPGAVDMGVKMAGQGLHKVAPPIAADDDDTLVIRKDESSGERAAQNFLKSAFALQGTPPPKAAPVVQEVDTSSSFLDMF